MKTLTKILSVTALVVLCVCLFTLTASAETVLKYHAAQTANCTQPGWDAYVDLQEGGYMAVSQPESNYPPGAAISGTVLTAIPNYQPKQAHVADTGTKVNYRAPTCTYPGNMEYYTCQNCPAKVTADGTEISSVSIPPTGNHKWVEIDREEPGPARNGWILYECSDCNETKTEILQMTGILSNPENDQNLDIVIAERDVWYYGEEPMIFESPRIKALNDESGPNANYVGVRLGTSSLYQYSWDTFDFWSWDKYVKLGDKQMNSLRPGHYYLWIYDVRHPDIHTSTAEFDVIEVATLEPYSTDKHVVNSSKSLRFIASEEIDPNSVWVGSRKLYDANDFFVSNDRKNITLSPDFLNARQTGTYTISALTKGGETIKTNFYILSTAQASSSPRTGDESQIGLWAAFLLLSGAAIVVMVPKLRKNGVK